MERKIGEVFEYKGVRLRVEKEINGCKECYFYRGGINHCIDHPVRNECKQSTGYNKAVIFVKVEDMNEMNKLSILDEAKGIIQGSRQSDYGDPVESFNRIAKAASMIAGEDLSPKECCAVLMAVKIVRESFKHKRDNLIDLCGYAHIMNELNENESEKEGE